MKQKSQTHPQSPAFARTHTHTRILDAWNNDGNAEGGYVMQFASYLKVEKLLSCCSQLYIEGGPRPLLSGLFVQPHPS